MKKPKIKKLGIKKLRVAKLDNISSINGGTGIASLGPTDDDGNTELKSFKPGCGNYSKDDGTCFCIGIGR